MMPTVRSLASSEFNCVMTVPASVASLLYGSGLRLLECLELRVKDLDFETRQITIQQGKGRKDREGSFRVSLRA